MYIRVDLKCLFCPHFDSNTHIYMSADDVVAKHIPSQESSLECKKYRQHQQPSQVLSSTNVTEVDTLAFSQKYFSWAADWSSLFIS